MTQKVKPSTLADTSVSAGTYGGSTQQVVFTVDAQGRLTYAANATPSIANTQITGLITNSQINSVANTKITGVIIPNQVAAGETYNMNITGSSGSANAISSNLWTINTSNTKVSFAYNGTTVFAVYTNGSVVAKDDITGFGAP